MRWFSLDDAIQSEEVYVATSPDEKAQLMPREDAVAIAHAQGLNLILECPEQLTTGPPIRWIQIGGPVSRGRQRCPAVAAYFSVGNDS